MDLLLQAMSLALADIDLELRQQHPDIFARVDEILAQPDRVQPDYSKIVLDERCQRWCAWCGCPFGVERPLLGTRCCSHACRGQYAAFKKRRAA